MAAQYGPGVSAYNIQLTSKDSAGRVQAGSPTKESADKASELLMVNHVRYHTLFDYVGFHSAVPIRISGCAESARFILLTSINRPHCASFADPICTGGYKYRNSRDVRFEQVVPALDATKDIEFCRRTAGQGVFPAVHRKAGQLCRLPTLFPGRDYRKRRG